ncbi:MAG: hypothetical protein GX801_02145 [Fibrobacter sp.]|nr:hypothetical protein [Fibrobacter sp.]
MNKKYILAFAGIALSGVLLSCGSGEIFDLTEDLDAITADHNFVESVKNDSSKVNEYVNKYGNEHVPDLPDPEPDPNPDPNPIPDPDPNPGPDPIPDPDPNPDPGPFPPIPPASSSSAFVPPLPTPSSSSAAVIPPPPPPPPPSSSSQGIIIPDPEPDPDPIPDPGGGISIVGDNVQVDIPDGSHNITIAIASWAQNNKTSGTFSCNGQENTSTTIDIGGVTGTVTSYYGSISNVPANGTGTVTVSNGPAKCQMGW